ncbi:hypothetical protein CLV88_11485 [Shimia abyssi]|uniref:Probable membrane transporter protein n=2 Tax=Shimia abyssi TaxID=1662395 RepID=A0A2P8F820_9RHOB|nr:sulfite exporter TauE/SafE family protein [Shimia abyssi]PSL17873.1 hypothetical protein CLV88_11485 [Shimia abyssi]
MIANFGPLLLLASVGIGIFAGVIKGIVGFGMPMLLISGLSMFLSPEWALAGLIFPTLATNGMQALRQGHRAAVQSVIRFRVFLLVGGVALVISAQFVRFLEPDTFLLLVGIPITAFAGMQLFGVTFHLSKPSQRIEALVGATAGTIGGISGVWGPPTVAYLTALGTEKAEQVRVQGVIYGLGAALLCFAHIGSGVLRWETLPFSIFLILPAMAGTWLGARIHDRIDQATFRKATLFVLTIVGLNLIRRGLMG